MHKPSILVILACVVAYVLAAARVYPYEPKPAKYACLVGCYLSELDLVIPVDKPHYPQGKCEVFECQPNNLTYWYSCGVVAVPSGCRVVQNMSQHYPDCCGKTICDTTTQPPTTKATCDESPTEEASPTDEPPVTNEAAAPRNHNP